jgi:hypothetical protein
MARKPTIAPRKPPRADERDEFVVSDGRPGNQAGRPGNQAPRSSGARKSIIRADGRELRKLHIYLAAKTAKRLAVFCAEVERDMSAVVEEAVSRYLAAEAE